MWGKTDQQIVQWLTRCSTIGGAHRASERSSKVFCLLQKAARAHATLAYALYSCLFAVRLPPKHSNLRPSGPATSFESFSTCHTRQIARRSRSSAEGVYCRKASNVGKRATGITACDADSILGALCRHFNRSSLPNFDYFPGELWRMLDHTYGSLWQSANAQQDFWKHGSVCVRLDWWKRARASICIQRHTGW